MDSLMACMPTAQSVAKLKKEVMLTQLNYTIVYVFNIGDPHFSRCSRVLRLS